MFNSEFKRAISRNSTLIVIFLGISIALLDILNNNVINLTSDDYWDYSFGVFTWWFMYSQSTYQSLIIIIFPILVSVAYSDSYSEDIKSGFIKNIITRYSKNNYLFIRFFVNFLLGGIVLSVPFIVNLIIYLLLIPDIEPNIFFGAEVVRYLFPDLYYDTPIIHAFVKLFICFIYGGIFSSIALVASIFIKNRFAIIVIPILIFQITQLFSYSFNLNKISPQYIIFYDTSYSNFTFLIPIAMLIILLFCFFIGGKRNEDF